MSKMRAVCAVSARAGVDMGDDVSHDPRPRATPPPPPAAAPRPPQLQCPAPPWPVHRAHRAHRPRYRHALLRPESPPPPPEPSWLTVSDTDTPPTQRSRYGRLSSAA